MTQIPRNRFGVTALIGAALLAVPVWAEGRAAPGYFLDTLVATSTAQQLALSCPSISVNPSSMQNVFDDVKARLERDGFDLDRDDLGMRDVSEPMLARQQAFMAKHNLTDGAPQEVVCASARAEMAEGTQIGSYLVEVSE